MRYASQFGGFNASGGSAMKRAWISISFDELFIVAIVAAILLLGVVRILPPR
jgi:hypothetical protein